MVCSTPCRKYPLYVWCSVAHITGNRSRTRDGTELINTCPFTKRLSFFSSKFERQQTTATKFYTIPPPPPPPAPPPLPPPQHPFFFYFFQATQFVFNYRRDYRSGKTELSQKQIKIKQANTAKKLRTRERQTDRQTDRQAGRQTDR